MLKIDNNSSLNFNLKGAESVSDSCEATLRTSSSACLSPEAEKILGAVAEQIVKFFLNQNLSLDTTNTSSELRPVDLAQLLTVMTKCHNAGVAGTATALSCLLKEVGPKLAVDWNADGLVAGLTAVGRAVARSKSLEIDPNSESSTSS